MSTDQEAPKVPESTERPPRDQLVRAAYLPSAVREDADSDSGRPVLHGHFARFNEWTEIDSREGRFMERLAPGAFAKTLSERAPRVLFNHGADPDLGNKLLGKPINYGEDKRGAWYEVELFEGIPPLLLDGLRSGEYGASFRFSIPKDRDEWDNRPRRSTHNPEGIPERTIREVRLYEFGPVSFPAYAGATAGVRSEDDSLGRLAFFADALTQLIRSAPSVAPADEQIEEDERSDAEAEPHLADAPAESEQATEPAETRDTSTTDAPSTEGAGTESHPARERRVSTPRDPSDRSWIHGETPSPRSSKWNP
jgi:HK97 family phage prohead protease